MSTVSPLVGPLGWGLFLGFFVIFVFLASMAPGGVGVTSVNYTSGLWLVVG
nr:hypothetical protein [Vulcanisaeta sp. JCM 16159]